VSHTVVAVPDGAGAELLRLRTHYFLIHGMFGATGPYLPVFLRDEKVLSPGEIGTIFALAQAGAIVMPPLLTLLADRFRVMSPLVMALFIGNFVAMSGLGFASGFTACLLAVAMSSFSNQPQGALADGLFFTLQQRAHSRHLTYPSVRIWGSVGFLCTSALVFLTTTAGMPAPIIGVAAVTAAIGFLNARRLPRTLPPTSGGGRLPTFDAARLLLRPPLFIFCLGIGLILFTNAAYYSFYPLYLTEVVGFEPRWVGLIASIGVVLELGYLLLFDRFRSRISLPAIIIVGSFTCVLRMAMLAFLPSPFWATAFQLFHGVGVIGVFIAPAMYLNSLAGDNYRSSVQGLYVMLVPGGFSILGNLISGQFAAVGLMHLYQISLWIALIGTALLVVAFGLQRRAQRSAARV
jgi:MFS transporter, PPP family, 3-phenylpropionic acid transporter